MCASGPVRGRPPLCDSDVKRKSQCHPVVDTRARLFDASVNAVQRATDREKRIKKKKRKEKKKKKEKKKRRKEEARKANGQEIWTIIVQEKNGRSMTRENSSTAAARLDDSMKILAWKKRWIDVKS